MFILDSARLYAVSIFSVLCDIFCALIRLLGISEGEGVVATFVQHPPPIPRYLFLPKTTLLFMFDNGWKVATITPALIF